MPVHDLAVIGEGISGLTCAGAAARLGLTVATFESQLFGGLVLNVNELDGYPGAESGTELASSLMQSNSEAGVTSVQDEVVAIRRQNGGFEVTCGGGSHAARAVVVASGARLKKLGIPGEQEFEGRGVSSCADCDAPMYMNEDVVVVGGGDSALQEALVLAKYCRSVRIVHRGERLRARKHLAERVSAEPKITIAWKTTVEAVLGSKMVEKVRVRGNGATEEIPCAGLFAYVGLAPNAAFVPETVERDGGGHIITDNGCETAVKGLWAVGAVRAGYSGLLKDAAAEAERAARAVVAWLKE